MAKCNRDIPPGEPRPRTCAVHGLHCPPDPSGIGKALDSAVKRDETPRLTTAKVQLELSSAWIRANPWNAIETVANFINTHRGMNITVRQGFGAGEIVVVAYRNGESSEVEA